MKRRNENMRNGGGGPRTRLATKVVTAIATFSLVMSMCPGTAALAFANEQFAGKPTGDVPAAGATSSLRATAFKPELQVNELLRTDENGVASRNGNCLRPANLTISGYDTGDKAIQSALVVARNSVQTKVLDTSDYTVQDVDGTSISSGGTTNKNAITVKFGEGASMADAQAWLRENLVITAKGGKACEVEISVSDEDLTANPATPNEQSQPGEAMKKLTGGNAVGIGPGMYYVSEDVEYRGSDFYASHPSWGVTENHQSKAGLYISGKVFIYIMKGATLKAVGGNGLESHRAAPGIYVTDGRTLCLAGSGKIVARGGNAGDGREGADAHSTRVEKGGAGGAGAGAGIGTFGGRGAFVQGGLFYEARFGDNAGKICIMDGLERDISGGTAGKAGKQGWGSGYGDSWGHGGGGGGGVGAICGRGGQGGAVGENGRSGHHGTNGANGAAPENMDESVSTSDDFSTDFTVTFNGATENGTQEYSLGTAKTLTVPEPSDASGKILLGWQVTQCGRSIQASDVPLTSMEQTYYVPGQSIELTDDTYGNITLTAITVDSIGEVATGKSSSTIPAGELVTADTHTMKTGTYRVSEDMTVGPGDAGNGIQVEAGANVVLNIEKGTTLTVTGKDAVDDGVGYAAILLPENASLIVAGGGTLNATGGKAGAGTNGGNAAASTTSGSAITGNGGHGGKGGGGAGAGIGSNGGAGGEGGAGGNGVEDNMKGSPKNVYANEGASGSAGSSAASAGTVLVMGTATVNAKGGAGGTGGKAGKRGWYSEYREFGAGYAAGTSGGGGGGGGGSAADGIGSGGTGGGGGGGGASANIDGEPAFFKLCNLDDLWGHGGSGGMSAWGGATGERGDEGASNDGDDTSASRNYAKAGGASGTCAAPSAVAFYTCKDSSSSNPKCASVSGHGATRGATSLGEIDTLKGFGGVAVGGTFAYDGKAHGVTVGKTGGLSTQSTGSNTLSTQAAGDEGDEWPDSGTVTLDGVTLSYSIAYYDEAGGKLDSAPTMPGCYAAVVTLAASAEGEDDYSGSWVEPITITKRQVAKPTPAALTFECADWTTGEGAEQDAFPGLDGADFEFVPGAKAVDGTSSLKTAKAVGDYAACFKLKDTATCQWEGESEDAAEAWVPWSIALQEFDPNSDEVTYWGTAYDNTTTSVDYTGEPIWVRPWFTPAKATDGKFPEWFTHWGSKDRPTDDRDSAVVVYTQGDDDYEGLVGYHENADGTLEKVTGAQVYAWMFGVDVGGEHVTVESGDKVWYGTGEDGEATLLAVQEARPEGADGYVVARDPAYATHLGVKDEGTYQAYAYFDDGAGFAPTTLATSTVEVKAPAQTPKTGTSQSSSASATPKTGDFSPFVMGSIAFIGVLVAGAFALSLARRRS